MPQAENFIRVTANGSPGLGERQIAAYPHAQLPAKRLFQLANLAAHGRLADAQFRTCPHNAPLARNQLEVVQMMVVEPIRLPAE